MNNTIQTHNPIQTYNPTRLTTASPQSSSDKFEHQLVIEINKYLSHDSKKHARKIEQDLATTIKGTHETLGDYFTLEKKANHTASIRVKKFLTGSQSEQLQLQQRILNAFGKNHGSSKHSSFTLSLKNAVSKNDALQEFTRKNGKFKVATTTVKFPLAGVPALPSKPSLPGTSSHTLNSKEISLPKESSPQPTPAIATLQQRKPASAVIHPESELTTAQAHTPNAQNAHFKADRTPVQPNVAPSNNTALTAINQPIQLEKTENTVEPALFLPLSLQEKKSALITKILNKYYNQKPIFKDKQNAVNKHFENIKNICDALNKAFPELHIRFEKNSDNERHSVLIAGTFPNTDHDLTTIMDIIEKGHSDHSSLIKIINSEQSKPLWNEIKGGIYKDKKAEKGQSRYLVFSNNETRLAGESRQNKKTIMSDKKAERYQQEIARFEEDIKRYNHLKQQLTNMIITSSPRENFLLLAERLQLTTTKSTSSITLKLVNTLKNSSAKEAPSLQELINNIPRPTFKEITYTPGDNLAEKKATLEKEFKKFKDFKEKYLSAFTSIIEASSAISGKKLPEMGMEPTELTNALKNLVNRKVSYKHFAKKPSFFNLKARFFAFVANRSDWKKLETGQKTNLFIPFESIYAFAKELNTLMPTNESTEFFSDFNSEVFKTKHTQAFQLVSSIGITKYHNDLKQQSFELGFGKLKRWALESYMENNLQISEWERNQLMTHKSQKRAPWKSVKSFFLGRKV